LRLTRDRKENSKYVYAGSFDPITAGHLSVIERAARLFDQLFVLVAVNTSKSTLFTQKERLEIIMDATGSLPNVRVAGTEGFVEIHRPTTLLLLCDGFYLAIDCPDITFKHSFQTAHASPLPGYTAVMPTRGLS